MKTEIKDVKMINLNSSIKQIVSTQLMFGIILLGFITTSANNSGDWFDKLSKINIGSTSRKGVEKLFEIESVTKEDVSFEYVDVSYGIDSGYFKVRYASGKGCSEITNMGYKLDKDIAVSYFFAANYEAKFSRLEAILDKLVSSEMNDKLEQVYSNPKTGKYYFTQDKSLISVVGQSFTSEQLKKYSCEHFIKQY